MAARPTFLQHQSAELMSEILSILQNDPLRTAIPQRIIIIPRQHNQTVVVVCAVVRYTTVQICSKIGRQIIYI
jgi:hypothetical protein